MRKLAWLVVVLLLLVSGLFFVRYVNLTNTAASPEARKLLGLSTYLLQRGMVTQAAEGIGLVRGVKESADFSLLVSIGAGSLALVSFVILAATHRSRRRDEDDLHSGPQTCPQCDEPVRGFELRCRNCGHALAAWSR